MTEVFMPKYGDGMEEGRLVEWHKKEGDSVEVGDILCSVETDKAVQEMEADAAGTLAGVIVGEGESVPVGATLAAILGKGEKLPENWGKGKEKDPKPEKVESENGATEVDESKADGKQEKVEEKVEEKVGAAAKSGEKASSGRVKASPLAKKIAEELGVDLEAVDGSGPGGRIVEKDVRSAADPGGTETAARGKARADKKVELGRLRRITADRTLAAKQEVPHFYVTVEVDVEALMDLREWMKEQDGPKVSVNDFVMKATAQALLEHPNVNATFRKDHVLQYGAVHMGMAVAVSDGLLVAVIKDADRKSVREIGEEARTLAKKAVDGKLDIEEMQGSTFTISNMGMLNVDSFTAIINTPNAGILAIGTASKKVVVNSNDELEIRWRMNITGSFDHRVVDGSVGADFINSVRSYLENPAKLLAW